MTFLIGAANSASGNFQIDNSLRVNGDLHHLGLVFDSSETDANKKKFSFSCWIKLGNADQYTTTVKQAILESTDATSSTDTIGYGHPAAAKFFYKQGAGNKAFSTTAEFRDPSAWYNLIIVVDTTDGTANDRCKIWVNGVAQTLIQSNGALAENSLTNFGTSGSNVDATSPSSGNFIHNINTYYNSYENDRNMNGYFADLNFNSGVVGDYSSYGKYDTNGVWIPKVPALAYNAFSYRLEFKQTGTGQDANGIGADTSGSANHFKRSEGTGLDATNIATDSPTNNFATLNPLQSSLPTNAVYQGLLEGNLKSWTSSNDNSADYRQWSTIAIPHTNKWFVETYWSRNQNDHTKGRIGILGYHDDVTHGVVLKGDFGKIVDNTASSYASGSMAYGEIFGALYDLPNNQVTFYENGTSLGAISWTPISHYTYHHVVFADSQSLEFYVNFGNPVQAISSSNSDPNGYGSFEHSTNSGYALCTKNLAEYG